MIIQSSNVAMGSQRTYSAVNLGLMSYSSWGNRNVGKTTTAAATLPTAKESAQTRTKNETGRAQVQVNGLKWRILTQEKKEEFVPKDPIEYGGFRNLLELLFHAEVRNKDWREMLRGALERNRMGSINWQPAGNEGFSYHEIQYHAETEETRFYSEGIVKTADGRSISFDIEAAMSRSFEEYAEVNIDYRGAAMVDPLVINLGGGSAEIRDQKFLFDIDADGELDNISLLGEMCGFLALDRNGDGVINDGSELFGTKSGDGFRDLAVFDMDGNGWIDENDPIFNKLRIWTKDAQGRDKLVGLGVAGVGAIYLGNVSTEFSVGEAKIQKTGVYLKENGQAGILQHVDFAVS